MYLERFLLMCLNWGKNQQKNVCVLLKFVWIDNHAFSFFFTSFIQNCENLNLCPSEQVELVAPRSRDVAVHNQTRTAVRCDAPAPAFIALPDRHVFFWVISLPVRAPVSTTQQPVCIFSSFGLCGLKAIAMVMMMMSLYKATDCNLVRLRFSRGIFFFVQRLWPNPEMITDLFF